MQAAVGVAQLERLPGFVAARRANFAYLRSALADLGDVLLLPEPQPNSEPSWFGFPILVRDDAPFGRDALVQFLEGRHIATRLIFAGNLVRQPAYKGLTYRTVGDLANSDRVMRNAFWVGVWPGLTEPMLDWVIESIRTFCRTAYASAGTAATA
jgi:CDP-6-deoxy-D-xylo-4-hexulose-3-dehydrase